MAHAREPDLEFHLNEKEGTVWYIKEGDSYRLGPKDYICEEMCRFLAELDYGER